MSKRRIHRERTAEGLAVAIDHYRKTLGRAMSPHEYFRRERKLAKLLKIQDARDAARSIK